MVRRAPLLVLVGLALALSWSHWDGPVSWTPDGLFYESQRLELQGDTAQQARRVVFDGQKGAQVKRESPQVRSASWVRESADFYRRRWLVPLVAAAIAPLFGSRSILIVSMAAYVAIGVLLFFLLRRWFSAWIASVTAAVCLALWPLREWSFHPLTDSLGIALLVLAIIVAPKVVSGGRSWLLAWFAVALALAFTRDTAVVVVIACVAAAVLLRSRRWLAMLGASAAAAVVPSLSFGVPVRKEIAYTLNGYRPVRSPTWSYILAHYPAGVRRYLDQDLTWVAHHPAHGVCFAVGTLAAVLAAVRKTVEPFVGGVLLGGVVFLLANPNWTDFRLELVLLPVVAVGVAFCFEVVEKAVAAHGGALRARLPLP